MKTGFIGIGIGDYVERHLKSNPGERKEEVTQALQDALDAHRRGERCECGNPIWVIGSAFVGHACFTCITGEATPDDDFEIDEALENDG